MTKEPATALEGHVEGPWSDLWWNTHGLAGDGLFWRHRCARCRRVVHDCLPMRCCAECGSPDVTVTFDSVKRERQLAKYVKRSGHWKPTPAIHGGECAENTSTD